MVYFIQGVETGNIKIGHTTNHISTRLNQIQSSDRLICLKVILGSDDDRMYQDKFRHLWSHGEWFRPEKDLLDFIGTLPENEYANLKQTGLSPWDRQSGNKGKSLPSSQKEKISESMKQVHSAVCV